MRHQKCCKCHKRCSKKSDSCECKRSEKINNLKVKHNATICGELKLGCKNVNKALACLCHQNKKANVVISDGPVEDACFTLELVNKGNKVDFGPNEYTNRPIGNTYFAGTARQYSIVVDGNLINAIDPAGGAEVYDFSSPGTSSPTNTIPSASLEDGTYLPLAHVSCKTEDDLLFQTSISICSFLILLGDGLIYTGGDGSTCPVPKWTANVGGVAAWNVNDPQNPIKIDHLQSDYNDPSFPFPLAEDIRQRVRDIVDATPTGLGIIDPSYPQFLGELYRIGVTGAVFPFNTIVASPGWVPLQGFFAGLYTDQTSALRINIFKKGCREILAVSRISTFIGDVEFWDITDPNNMFLITVWSGNNYYLQEVLHVTDRQYEELDPNDPVDSALIQSVFNLGFADQFPQGVPARVTGTQVLQGGGIGILYAKGYNKGNRMFYLSPQYLFILDIEDFNNIKIISQFEDPLLNEIYNTDVLGWHDIDIYKTCDGRLHAVVAHEVPGTEVPNRPFPVRGGISIWDLCDENKPRLTASYQNTTQAGLEPIEPVIAVKDVSVIIPPFPPLIVDVINNRIGFTHSVSIGKFKCRNYVYVKDNGLTVYAIDIEDPCNPFEVARFDLESVGDNPNIPWALTEILALSVYKDKNLITVNGGNNMYGLKEVPTSNCKKQKKCKKTCKKISTCKSIKGGVEQSKYIGELWKKFEEGDEETKDELIKIIKDKFSHLN